MPVTKKATPTDTSNNGTEQRIELPHLDLQLLKMNIIGVSPLICHRWADKAKRQMLDKQQKRASTGRAAKDPEEDYLESLYVHPDGGYGFPAIAFKAAAVRAGTYSEMKMTFLRGTFHVIGGELVKIVGEPRPREDMVRIGMGTADIRYRAEFPEWSAVLPIRYNAKAITVEQLANLFRIAGFSVGIGEWRPEKDGSYGMFEVQSR